MTEFALDLFAGPGGWSLAARHLGVYESGVENEKNAIATRNEMGFVTCWEDVRTFDLSQPQFNYYDGLIASPPCQTFSVAGKGKGRENLDIVLDAVRMMGRGWKLDSDNLIAKTGDERTALVLEPLRYALALKPKWIALEQVPTVLPVWEAFAGVLREQGYQTWTGCLHAEQYGVPQTRKRAVLMAHRDRLVAPPTPTHSKYYPRDPKRLDPGVKPWISMAEALGWPPATVVSNYGTGGDPRNRGERESDEPFATVTSKVDRMKVWPHNRPSTTIVGSFKPEIVAAPGYRTTVSRQNAPDSVRVTPAEAGVLQSFPANFPWQGTRTRQFQQIGNAIPVLLAEAVLSELI